MEQLTLDVGIKEYNINGKAVLRFNPADPNVYERYISAIEKIDEIEKEMSEKAKKIKESDKDYSVKSLHLMREADIKAKEILSNIFGEGNDMEQIFEGVNVMAVSTTGKRVIENFMDIIGPIIESGASNFIAQRVNEAMLNREQRRKMQK